MSTGLVTVITGAAGALGSAVARHLVAHGHRIAALDRQGTEERLSILEKELGPANWLGLTADVAAASDWSRALERVNAHFGAPTGAVLTAGGYAGGVPLHAAEDDSAWESMMRGNLETVYRAMRALLPAMVEQQRGSIVVVGARGAVRPEASAGAAAYAASKAAVVTLAQTVAAEVHTAGVRVNAVLPSILDTPANRNAMPDVDPRYWVAPASLAEVIAFLLSEASRDISGSLVPVYGQA